MRPGYVIDKALQKLCANDTAAGPPAGDVFYVGCITVDLSVVASGERQTPDLLANRLTGPDQPLGELVVV